MDSLLASSPPFRGLSDAAKNAFRQRVQARHYDKHAYLIRSGDTHTGLHLITQGMVRLVYTTREGKEFNKSFAAEGEFVGCLLSMLSDEGCRFAVQALEATHTVYLSNDHRKTLIAEFAEWETVARVLAERLALKKEAREAAFLLDSAELRYQRLLEQHPDWIERLAQYHIASYLGITDVALSRIRHRKL